MSVFIVHVPLYLLEIFGLYSKTCVKRPLSNSQKDQILVFKTNYRLMQAKSIAECSMGSILQYFPPSFKIQSVIKIFVIPRRFRRDIVFASSVRASVRPFRPDPYLSTYWSDLIHSWYK